LSAPILCAGCRMAAMPFELSCATSLGEAFAKGKAV
jgi:hypothetical protein